MESSITTVGYLDIEHIEQVIEFAKPLELFISTTIKFEENYLDKAEAIRITKISIKLEKVVIKLTD